MERQRHWRWVLKKGNLRAQLRNFRIRDWSFWDWRSKEEVAAGVNWGIKGLRSEGWWYLRIDMALSTRKGSGGGGGGGGGGCRELTALDWQLSEWSALYRDFRRGISEKKKTLFLNLVSELAGEETYSN